MLNCFNISDIAKLYRRLFHFGVVKKKWYGGTQSCEEGKEGGGLYCYDHAATWLWVVKCGHTHTWKRVLVGDIGDKRLNQTPPTSLCRKKKESLLQLWASRLDIKLATNIPFFITQWVKNTVWLLPRNKKTAISNYFISLSLLVMKNHGW